MFWTMNYDNTKVTLFFEVMCKLVTLYRLNVMIYEWGRPLVPWYVANYHGIFHLIPPGKIFSHSVSVCVCVCVCQVSFFTTSDHLFNF